MHCGDPQKKGSAERSVQVDVWFLTQWKNKEMCFCSFLSFMWELLSIPRARSAQRGPQSSAGFTSPIMPDDSFIILPRGAHD